MKEWLLVLSWEESGRPAFNRAPLIHESCTPTVIHCSVGNDTAELFHGCLPFHWITHRLLRKSARVDGISLFSRCCVVSFSLIRMRRVMRLTESRKNNKRGKARNHLFRLPADLLENRLVFPTGYPRIRHGTSLRL